MEIIFGCHLKGTDKKNIRNCIIEIIVQICDACAIIIVMTIDHIHVKLDINYALHHHLPSDMHAKTIYENLVIVCKYHHYMCHALYKR